MSCSSRPLITRFPSSSPISFPALPRPFSVASVPVCSASSALPTYSTTICYRLFFHQVCLSTLVERRSLEVGGSRTLVDRSGEREGFGICEGAESVAAVLVTSSGL